jgi:hypothetical protein
VVFSSIHLVWTFSSRVGVHSRIWSWISTPRRCLSWVLTYTFGKLLPAATYEKAKIMVVFAWISTYFLILAHLARNGPWLTLSKPGILAWLYQGVASGLFCYPNLEDAREPEFAVHLGFNEPAHAMVYGLHQPASVPIWNWTVSTYREWARAALGLVTGKNISSQFKFRRITWLYYAMFGHCWISNSTRFAHTPLPMRLLSTHDSYSARRIQDDRWVLY